jgi:hypothetical protein
LACVVVCRAPGRSSRLARVGVSRIFMPRGARGSSQRGRCRQRVVLRTQATSFAALPGIQSSAIVQVTDGVACCRLTSHSSGRLRRRLIPALGSCLVVLSQRVLQPGSRQLSVVCTWLRACSAAASLKHPKLLALRSAGLAVVPAQSPKHGAAQAPNSSFKRTAPPPLNSGVRPQRERSRCCPIRPPRVSLFGSWF